MKKKLLIYILIFSLLATGTALVVFFGKGYRFNFGSDSPIVSGNGLLVATSVPNGAQVFINGNLTTATDNTINLSPGEYEIRIFKEGYFPWTKTITIKKEVVSKAEALLLPSAPKLDSITNIGVSNPVLDPTKTKIAYTVASQSAVKDGVYILDMTSRPILTLQSASSQITTDIVDTFSSSFLTWSPDSREILASVSASAITRHYLLRTNTLNENPQNVTAILDSVNVSWERLKEEKDRALVESLPRNLRSFARDNFNILEWSSDETKILYEASGSATIPLIINPPLLGTNSTPEQREIKEGEIYVYDIKEDRNYKILNDLDIIEGKPLPLMFLPTSMHLVYVHDGKIDIMEYDAQNQTTIYAGPFVDNFVFPWPDASRIVILTNLGNPNIAPNLYTISLK